MQANHIQTMRISKLSGLLTFLVAIALSISAWGQATTTLHGVVTDPSGAAIPGAKVTITNAETSVSRQAATTSAGVYTFVAVLPGTYELAVAATGFRTYKQSGVVLLVNLPATVNVQMLVGAVTQSVQVNGEAPLLNTTNASVGQAISSMAITNLPIRAENTALLLSFQPGVVYNGTKNLAGANAYDTRAGSVNGERSDQNNITLDGVDNNNEFESYGFTGVLPTTPFSVQEFRVTTSNYGATGGHTAGAQITMVTKSGTNHFHGSLYEFNRTNAGEANDYFLKSSQAISGQPNVPEHLVRNVFGGTIGGPFIHNRFFFFFNYEGRRQRYGQSVTRVIPSTTLRDGIIEYQCATAGDCPASTVTGVSGKSYPVAAGMYALSPSQLKGMDPLGIGPDPVMMKYFDTYPAPNNFTVGLEPNYAGYTFAAPTNESFNWYIVRLDYKLTKNGNQILFFRGTGVDDRTVGNPFLPGRPPETSTVDLSKGFVAGFTSVISPHWVNNFHYGLTRQSVGNGGDSDLPWIFIQGLDEGVTRSNGFTAPVHNIIDNINWQKGSHSFQFGANLVFIRRNSFTTANSFSDASLNSLWQDSSGYANRPSPLNPTSGGYPAVASGYNHSYDYPLDAMMGIADELDAQYNYYLNRNYTATLLAQGAPVVRHWATDTYNIFAQDTWQALSNLSVTYGLNYQLMTPITETAGQEVAPSVNMGSWFNDRSIEGQSGIASNHDPLVSFAPAGSIYGEAGLYQVQSKDFAPRIGIAWTPRPSWRWLKRVVGDGKTAVRAGFGMYYDNFGPELALMYDQSGAFGLSTSLSNPAGVVTVADAPRVTDMNTIPVNDNNGQRLMPAAPPSSFPVTFPVGSEAITRGIDPSLKTPYSYALDLSIQRQLPGEMTLDLSYVGHFAHRLLVVEDIAEPLDLTDRKTGVDYFTAMSRLSQLNYQGIPTSKITPSLVGPTAQYWMDMFAPSPNGEYNSSCANDTTLLQAVYDWDGCTLSNETFGLWEMDVLNHGLVPTTGANSFFNSQFSSLNAWRSIGFSNYNAMDVGLHKQMSRGFLFGFDYTFSKSLDVESLAGRGFIGGLNNQLDNQFLIINSWSPYQLYAPSDFDVRQQVNYYWVAKLPFGKGEPIGNRVKSWANAIIGGWQLSGTGRWTSGFPGSVFMGFVWPTNWETMGQATLTGEPIDTGTETTATGNPNLFTDPTAAKAGFAYTLPGQSGARNVVRGDGYFGLDMSLRKEWRIPKTEGQSVGLRWNVYNVLNTNRFDIDSANLEEDTGSVFGNYASTLTKPRTMEFSLIYQF